MMFRPSHDIKLESILAKIFQKVVVFQQPTSTLIITILGLWDLRPPRLLCVRSLGLP